MSGRVPVIIPTLNEAAHIAGVIRDLADEEAPGGGYAFMVVDGGSTDGTREAALALVAEGLDVRVADNPKRLQSAAVNLAVEELTSDVFVRCDAHAGYPKGFIRLLLAEMETQGADSVVTSMTSVGETCLQKAIAWVSNTPVGTGGSAHRGGGRSGWVDHGHHAVFRTALFRAAGGYDERLVANEDAELDARLKAMGGRIYLVGEPAIGYFPRKTFGALAKQYYRYGYGRAYTCLIHRGSMRLRQAAVPLNLILVAASLLLAPVSIWFLAWPALYLAILSATSVGIAVSQRSACGLLAGPAALAMHMAWALGFLIRMAQFGHISGRLAPIGAKPSPPLAAE